MTAIPRRMFRGLIPEPEVHKLLNSIMNTLLGLKENPLCDYLVKPRQDLHGKTLLGWMITICFTEALAFQVLVLPIHSSVSTKGSTFLDSF